MTSIFETIKPRGIAPYRVGTGKELPPNEPEWEQFSDSRPTFADALAELFDLSGAGKTYVHGQRILDATNTEVFTLTNPKDLAQLQSLDQEK